MQRFICSIPRATDDEMAGICSALSAQDVGWYHFGNGVILVSAEAPDSGLDIDGMRSLVQEHVAYSRMLIYGLEDQQLVFPDDGGRSAKWLGSHFNFFGEDDTEAS